MKDRTEDARRFIEVWQTSGDIDEVLRRMGARRRGTVIQRAARYRSMGIELKRMPSRFERAEALDWEGLSEYASAVGGVLDEREG